MLKRVALIRGTEMDLEACADACPSDDLSFIASAASDSLPQYADAMLTTGDPTEALALATALAERHVNLLGLLADAIDCREQIPQGSSARACDHASRLAKAVGLNDDDRLSLERGVLLRDIGKLRISNDVLLKDGALSYDEWAFIQDHPNLGADMVQKIDGLKNCEEVIRHHHESFDGAGYPKRLEEDDIPYLARAAKIIDVYCAMTSPRIYRATVATKAKACDYLREERGKHFDPTLVDAFLDSDVGDEAMTSS